MMTRRKSFYWDRREKIFRSIWKKTEQRAKKADWLGLEPRKTERVVVIDSKRFKKKKKGL